MKRLENKIAFVTGGSRGMGAAISKRLAAEGAHVVFTYSKSKAKAEAVAAEINVNGGQAQAVQADSIDPKALTAAIQQTIAELGPIDILVNNAGIYIGKEFKSHTLEDYEEIMAINVRAVYVASLAVVPHMSNHGRVITIGSNMAENSVSPQTTLYTMSKAALAGFTRGLARDLGAKGITVNLVQPGPINTDMNPSDSDLADFLRSRMALSEYGTGDDVAGLVAFLASTEGKYITGTAITIDGGLNA
ncbi:SDR family NAD(P)-dependent oxidoreductase [Pedobacter gandavensis]|uniref:SDR family oxidoreductase n=1 Tax=Pedobacter gandavensis TaxID=2679963 RepID=A0ABR6ESQ5_9SPHI|nr:SDR family oxidoreductase [Pedobacter gandavensis]MBB2148305.1 SDR family oxidoreductase [Pedobacter gandavensis]